ncbi:MAG: hypothetical protein ACKVQQ_09975 [Burkholderiales bacterium]
MEYAWLGAEALPAGLAQINETIEAWGAAGHREKRLLRPVSRQEGLISIAVRWMREAIRRV